MNSVPLWHLENFSGLLIGCNLANSAYVALIVAEWLSDEKLNQTQHFILAVLPSTDSDDVGIVVLSS